jgi:hypothetical protein
LHFPCRHRQDNTATETSAHIRFAFSFASVVGRLLQFLDDLIEVEALRLLARRKLLERIDEGRRDRLRAISAISETLSGARDCRSVEWSLRSHRSEQQNTQKSRVV